MSHALDIGLMPKFFTQGESPSLVHVFNGGKSVIFIRGDVTYCFGENNKRTLGIKSDKCVYSPTRVEYLQFNGGIEALASGESHVVALDKSGQVYSWGDNEWGQLGDGTQEGPRERPLIVTLPFVKDVSCGYRYTLALDDNNKVWYWGCLDGGVMKSDFTFPVRTTPICISSIDIITVSCGGFHAAIVTDSGQVMTWGWNGYGQLGHGHTKTVDAPKIVAEIEPIILHVSCGRNSTLTLDAEGRISVFGQTYMSNILSPKIVELKKAVVAVSMGWRYDIFAILDEEDYVHYWGHKVKLSEPTLIECNSIVDVFANKDSPVVYPPEAALIVTKKIMPGSQEQSMVEENGERTIDLTYSDNETPSRAQHSNRVGGRPNNVSLLKLNYDRLQPVSGKKRKFDDDVLLEYVQSTNSTLQLIENNIKEADLDEDLLFGRYIGSRLKKMNSNDKAELKYQIEKLFYEKTCKSNVNSNTIIATIAEAEMMPVANEVEM